MRRQLNVLPDLSHLPRFFVLFRNGGWVIFDREFYGHGPSYPLARLAHEECARWNTTK